MIIWLKLQIWIDKNWNKTTDYTELIDIYPINSILGHNLLENTLEI